MQADYTPLPNTVSLEEIRKGEVNTPEDLVKFFRYLVGGLYVGRELAAANSHPILRMWCLHQHLEDEDLQSIYKLGWQSKAWQIVKKLLPC